jgi:uncharacterized protein (DUF362 family)
MDPIVHISRGKDPYQTTRAILQRFPLPDVKGKSVLVKPNAARLASAGEGVTTHPLVVSATIDELKERGAAEIVIGESCIYGVNAQEAFRLTGMAEVAEKKGISLIDFDRLKPGEIDVPGGSMIRQIKVPALLKTFDLVISIPVMKTHMHTRVTLSIKNMKGLLWRREKARFHHLRYDEKITKGHKELDIAISEMASVLSPHLAVIDGTVGMEGMGPAYGRAKKMGLIVVGNNALSADAVAARLMGIAPETVPHLKLSAERGLGEIDLRKILIHPKDYMKWEAPFDSPPSRLSIPFPDVIVHDRGSCSACLSTLLVFLQRYHSELTDYRLEDEKVHIGIGKHLKDCPDGTILIGNCASRMKRKGIFVQGCPPVSSQIMDTLKNRPRVTKK